MSGLVRLRNAWVMVHTNLKHGYAPSAADSGCGVPRYDGDGDITGYLRKGMPESIPTPILESGVNISVVASYNVQVPSSHA